MRFEDSPDGSLALEQSSHQDQDLKRTKIMRMARIDTDPQILCKNKQYYFDQNHHMPFLLQFL